VPKLWEIKQRLLEHLPHHRMIGADDWTSVRDPENLLLDEAELVVIWRSSEELGDRLPDIIFVHPGGMGRLQVRCDSIFIVDSGAPDRCAGLVGNYQAKVLFEQAGSEENAETTVLQNRIHPSQKKFFDLLGMHISAWS
jgi:hypothetical protein